ncbi:tenascin-R-like [Mytilus trossulus]|uniref:tenascin-R-like n=1 Tax=Mytilus trossulus TaxID=6551 RepID=UPI00300477BE
MNNRINHALNFNEALAYFNDSEKRCNDEAISQIEKEVGTCAVIILHICHEKRCNDEAISQIEKEVGTCAAIILHVCQEKRCNDEAISQIEKEVGTCAAIILHICQEKRCNDEAISQIEKEVGTCAAIILHICQEKRCNDEAISQIEKEVGTCAAIILHICHEKRCNDEAISQIEKEVGTSAAIELHVCQEKRYNDEAISQIEKEVGTCAAIILHVCQEKRCNDEAISQIEKEVDITFQPSQNGYTSYSITSAKTSAETIKTELTPGVTTSVETTTKETTNGETTTREITRYATTKGDSHRYDTTIYITRFETTNDEADMEKTASVETTKDNSSNETGDDISNETDEEIRIGSTDKPGCQNYDTAPANKFYVTGNFSDCSEIPSGSPSGVYIIYVEEKTVDVYCEMTDYGQWTVIQRRLNGTTDFYRNWQAYKQGFGNVNFEYWLGNDNLYQILSTKNYKLRIDLEDWNCDKRYTEYDTFVVGSEETKYKLSITGYSGDAGDSIINPPSGSTYRMNGMEFTTSDRDNDEHWFINCASDAKHSGWWFNWSTDANLNGIYYINGQKVSDGVFWNCWHSSEYSLKSVSMKIKPY